MSRNKGEFIEKYNIKRHTLTAEAEVEAAMILLPFSVPESSVPVDDSLLGHLGRFSYDSWRR
ncbi:MAG: hypothetical protein CM15mV6_2170 [uncultured marine virus]|nr:MAG: hypothetical protein CM15mV6_2170 [uncultured marine virus]